MRLGVPQPVLISVGLVGAVYGLWLWHQQGRNFGLGESGGKVPSSAVVASVALLAALATVELICGSK